MTQESPGLGEATTAVSSRQSSPGGWCLLGLKSSVSICVWLGSEGESQSPALFQSYSWRAGYRQRGLAGDSPWLSPPPLSQENHIGGSQGPELQRSHLCDHRAYPSPDLGGHSNGGDPS